MKGAARIGMLVLIGMLSAGGRSYLEPAATSTAETIMSHLTGGSWRAWVKTRWITILARGAPRCEQGEIWTFSRDGKGVKRTCVNGVAHEEQFTWAWVGTEGDPPVLVTILRTLRADTITPVEEIILEFQDM
jgi:hypothetical protein